MDSQNDYLCSICLNVLANPVKTPCSHFFCKICLREMGNESNETPCPLCRQPVYNISGLQINSEMDKQVAKLFPKEYAQRMKEINNYLKEQDKFLKLVIEYGNTDEKVDDPQISYSDPTRLNTDDWCCFVKLQLQKGQKQSDYISKVEFLLDPTFSKPLVTVFSEPYQVSRIGYDVFQIPIKIYWKPWLKIAEPTQIYWNLQFNMPIKSQLYSIKVDKLVFKEKEKKKIFRF